MSVATRLLGVQLTGDPEEIEQMVPELRAVVLAYVEAHAKVRGVPVDGHFLEDGVITEEDAW